MSATLSARKRSERDAARDSLRELFPIGSTVSTKILHVSRSGMLRSVAVLVGRPDGSVEDVSGLVARATGRKLHRPTGGVAMGGCGMDMGFALVYSLARSLYSDVGTLDADGRPPFTCNGQDGSNSGSRCPSNDHNNERGDDYRTGFRAGRVHSDAGYALNHRWV